MPNLEDNSDDARELQGEVDRGSSIARSLVEHVSGMNAAGYTAEVTHNDELWTVEVKFLGRLPSSEELSKGLEASDNSLGR